MIYLNRKKSSIFWDFTQRRLAVRANISFTTWRKPEITRPARVSRSCNSQFVTKKEKERVALIMLIIALQFDVSTACNEKTEINKMNKNCIVCVYTVPLSQLRNY